MRCCFIIPCYNHDLVIDETVQALSKYALPIIIVDDGSQTSTKNILKQVDKKYAQVQLIHHVENGGKGAAMQTGLSVAIENKMTHALQIDADGQHDLNDLDAFMLEAEKYPAALISGKPVYDNSISKGRYYGRYITHFWVAIETLSFKVMDSMCGYRVYPLAEYEKLTRNTQLGKRMDFDIEVMVKLFWKDIDLRFIDTAVDYPEHGVSHFRALEDNILISWMHTRLFFGMLPRIPQLIFRKFR